MKEDCKIYDAKPGDIIENDCCGEKWVKCGVGNPAYLAAKQVADSLDDIYRISLMSVVDVDDGDCYLGLFCGGLNGGHLENKWIKYLDQIKIILENISQHAWLVDLTNDCCDDVWYLTIGFEMKK